MISDKKYEIMIVGGGPAGISTLLHLHKYAPELAEKTVLIEKEKYPRDKLCGGGVGAWSRVILKNLDIDLNIAKLFISDVEFIYGEESFILHQPDSFMMVQRTDFDHALMKNALKHGLHIIENESFLDFSYKNNSIIVKTDKQNYQLKTLVGADGSLSKVRHKMNLSNKQNLAPTLEIFSPVNSKYDKEFDKKKIVVDMTPQKEGLQGYFWHVPCIREEIPHVGHGLVDLRVCPEKKRADLKSIFASELKKRDIKISQQNWRSHPIRWPSHGDIMSKPNIILAGDAIGIEPAFGGGIHFALSYGKIAANSIINAYKTNEFSFKDYNKQVQSHLVGKFIDKCTRLAIGMNTNKLNPLDVAREVFTIKK